MVTIHSIKGQLNPAPPFDLEKSLDFLSVFPPMNGEQNLAPRALTKAVSIRGRTVVFQLGSSGTFDAPHLDYTLHAQDDIDQSLVLAAEDRIRFFLSLDDDLRSFYETGLSDAAFAPVIRRLYGLHQVKFLTPFEIACWSVINRRTSPALAKRAKDALVQQFGGALEIDGTLYRAFPEPDQMAEVSPEELRALIKNDQKAEYLLAVIRAFNQVDEKFLRTGEYAKVREWLLSIKGIGDWSTHFIMLRGLGRMELVPSLRKSAYEERLIEAVTRVYAPGKTLGPEGIEQLARRYGEMQGYWAYYLRAAAD